MHRVVKAAKVVKEDKVDKGDEATTRGRMEC